MDWNKIIQFVLKNRISRLIRMVVSSVLILMVKIYQYLISPLIPDSCRFTPTCSQYFIEAVKTHGVFKGSILSIIRIARCNPWGGFGADPVPPKGHWRSIKTDENSL